MAENPDTKPVAMQVSLDALFKLLLQLEGGLAVLLQTFFAEAASRLDLSTIRFLDKEQPKRSRRESGQVMDLLAEATLADGSGVARLHVEIEGEWRSRMRFRLLRYDAGQAETLKGSLFSVTLFLHGGKIGIGWVTVTLDGLEGPTLVYRSRALCLKQLDVEDWLTEACDPLIATLGAWMGRGEWSKAVQKLKSLQRIATVSDEDRRSVMVEAAETGLVLTGSDEEEFRRLSEDSPDYMEVRSLLTRYHRRGREEGLQEGLQKGFHRGKEETLIRQLQFKFGAIPEETTERIRAIDQEDLLDRCLERVLVAGTLEEVGLPNGSH